MKEIHALLVQEAEKRAPKPKVKPVPDDLTSALTQLTKQLKMLTSTLE